MLESLCIEELDTRDDDDRATLEEELVLIVLNDELPNLVIYTGSLLNPKLHEGLFQFPRENQGMFAWCHEDMLGIDPQIMLHKLNVNSDFCRVKKKMRAMASKRQKATNEEFGKLLKVGSIR